MACMYGMRIPVLDELMSMMEKLILKFTFFAGTLRVVKLLERATAWYEY